MALKEPTQEGEEYPLVGLVKTGLSIFACGEQENANWRRNAVLTKSGVACMVSTTFNRPAAIIPHHQRGRAYLEIFPK